MMIMIIIMERLSNLIKLSSIDFCANFAYRNFLDSPSLIWLIFSIWEVTSYSQGTSRTAPCPRRWGNSHKSNTILRLTSYFSYTFVGVAGGVIRRPTYGTCHPLATLDGQSSCANARHWRWAPAIPSSNLL